MQKTYANGLGCRFSGQHAVRDVRPIALQPLASILNNIQVEIPIGCALRVRASLIFFETGFALGVRPFMFNS
jgi:hypothetical protein